MNCGENNFTTCDLGEGRDVMFLGLILEFILRHQLFLPIVAVFNFTKKKSTTILTAI
jgi:hypothetical protein